MKRLPKSVGERNRRKDYAEERGKGRRGTPLEVGSVFALSGIFRRNGWIAYDGYEVIQDRFMSRLGKMNEEQKQLFLELTGRFYWKYDYIKEIVAQLNKILSQFNNYEKYYVLRCVKYDSERDVKSPGAIAYEIKNPLVQGRLVKPVKVLSKMKSLDGASIDFNKSLFIIVDDFIGSGDSAEKCIKDLINYNTEMDKKIVLMCLVALQQGVEKLKGMNVCVFADRIQKRGISDCYSGYELERWLRVMREIEKIVNPKEEYSFGYKQSEALVCLKRCPNNTFPVYWWGKDAPFAR